jgi:hypothetical protein
MIHEARKINITLQVTVSNLVAIQTFRQNALDKGEAVKVTLDPLSNPIGLNQKWLDGAKRVIKIIDRETTGGLLWIGETTREDGGTVQLYYTSGGYCTPNNSILTDNVSSIRSHNLIQLMDFNEPKPGEYWMDGRTNVWLIEYHDDDYYVLCAKGHKNRTWTKYGNYLKADSTLEGMSDLDLVSQVFISHTPL